MSQLYSENVFQNTFTGNDEDSKGKIVKETMFIVKHQKSCLSQSKSRKLNQ